MASQESTSAQDQAGSAPSNAPSTSPQQGPSSQFTNGLLMASGTAFLAGIFGSLWYQGRQDKRKGLSTSIWRDDLGADIEFFNTTSHNDF